MTKVKTVADPFAFRADYGGKAGSKTAWYEVIGYRKGVKHWAELIWVGDDAGWLHDTLCCDNDDLPNSWRGYERYQVLAPGTVRPCDVRTTSRTDCKNFMTGYEQNDHGDVDNLTKFVDHVFEMGREDISTYPPVAPALEHAMIDFAAMLDEA